MIVDRLQEAKEQLCELRGHSSFWRVGLEDGTNEPTMIACGDCGKRYKVVPADER